MSYDEKLAERVRNALLQRPEVNEKKMFGGLAFLLNGRMFCGIIKDELVVRVGPERYEEVLERSHVRPMDFTGRLMRGYVFIAPSGLRRREVLEEWVNMGVEFVSAMPPGSRRKRGVRSPRPARRQVRSPSR